MDMEGGLYSLLGVWRDFFQRPRAAERERGDARYRAESLVRQVDEAEGVVREARDRESNARAEATRVINDEMIGVGKEREIERERCRTFWRRNQSWRSGNQK